MSNGAIGHLPFYRGQKAEFEGFSIILAARPGGPLDAVALQPMLQNMGADLSQTQRSYIQTRGYPARVELDGYEVVYNLISRVDFFSLCQLATTPKLDRFRRRVAEILGEIQDSGGYVDPAAGASAVLNGRLKDDPIALQLRTLLEMRDRQLQLEHEVSGVRQIAESARLASDAAVATINGHHGWYALAPWAAKVAGISLSERDAAYEAAQYVVPLCRQRGVQPGKVHSSRYVSVNEYPEAVLREWADDYRRRHSIARLA